MINYWGKTAKSIQLIANEPLKPSLIVPASVVEPEPLVGVTEEILICEHLYGLPWDAFALGCVIATGAKALRVTYGEVDCLGMSVFGARATVFMSRGTDKALDVIHYITKEATVMVPAAIAEQTRERLRSLISRYWHE